MFALGQTRKSARWSGSSDLPPEADVRCLGLDVGFGPERDGTPNEIAVQ
jgi:hypothetical protein